MSRHIRLTRLLQELRRHRAPVTAAALAEAFAVSERTIHRDIDTLRQSGAVIDGAAGLGFTMTEDPGLRPQSFTREEIEALVLGLRTVAETGDPGLARAAESARAKLRGAVPPGARAALDHAVLDARRFRRAPAPGVDPAALRRAAQEEREIAIRYRDGAGAETLRRVRPLAIVYMDAAQMLLAWCALRQDFRSFRLDRIAAMEETGASFRPRRARLLAEAIAGIEARREEIAVLLEGSEM